MKMNLRSTHEDVSSISDRVQWARDQCCHKLWCSPRRSSDPKLQWLWCGWAAVAPIRPLAWELPYATGAALKSKKKKQKQKTKKNLKLNGNIMITNLRLVLKLWSSTQHYPYIYFFPRGFFKPVVIILRIEKYLPEWLKITVGIKVGRDSNADVLSWKFQVPFLYRFILGANSL